MTEQNEYDKAIATWLISKTPELQEVSEIIQENRPD